MSKKSEGWGCLLSIIAISILFVAIIPKRNNRESSGANKNNYWYKKRMECEKTKQEQKRIEQRQIELENTKKYYQNAPISTRTCSNAKTADDAFSEGYDEGYEQGKYDGSHGYSRGYGYDDSSNYYDYYETKYQEGYEEGYDNGYSEGQSDYEEKEENEDD